jgi:hypothetical protein
MSSAGDSPKAWLGESSVENSVEYLLEKVFVGLGAGDNFFNSIPQSFFDGLPKF